MQSRQFLTFKFKSARLKEFGYNISLTVNEARDNNELIALFDNQILRSIREITDKEVDYIELDQIKSKIKKLENHNNSEQSSQDIIENKRKLDRMTFIPEYITIEINHCSHYKYLFEKGLILNGRTFKRLNSSASQARTSTVVFADESILEELNDVLDNGRNKNKELAPSKFNAYKGLYGSSTRIVSTPRFCVVPDYESESTYKAHYVTETEWDEDDELEEVNRTENINRFDGQGLISPRMAKNWADELGLDYTPAQFCIRGSYLKGMVNVFDFHKFCETENNGDYVITTSYEDENQEKIKVNLKEIDVIITESQAKLWDSWNSIEEYKENCENNNLHWGVSIHTPKKDKDILTMNYQFLQSLNLKGKDIHELCEQFVDWVSGVSHNDIYYTMLFLLGKNIDGDNIESVILNQDYWVQSLIANPNLINDKYIKRKVYNLIKNKIKRGCLGEIIVDGNFQVIVSDPYAMMQHVCGQKEVDGLLGKYEYYSNYWNEKGVDVVNSMRSPLTYRSEHVLLDLKKSDQLDYWYRYNYTGIIVNVHGEETVRWAGSDFDYDILATTSNKTIVESVYRDELPVVYDPPKPEKVLIDDDKLYNADLFSFGSIIGSITNKSTTGFSLLSDLKEGSEEYKTTINRIRMCTKLQSAQIDKAKIGEEVKGIPNSWTNYQKVNEDDEYNVVAKKNLQNSVMLDKHPYFFIYNYVDTKKKYKKHYDEYSISCQQKFGVNLDDLMNKKRKTKEEIEFIDNYYKHSPVIENDCVMNNICKHIESIEFNIRDIVKTDDGKYVDNLLSKDFNGVDEKMQKDIIKVYKKYSKSLSRYLSMSKSSRKSGFDEEKYNQVVGIYEKFKEEMTDICSNKKELVNHLVYTFYYVKPEANKNILWSLYGDQIHENVKSNMEYCFIPIKDDDGEINYLGENYKLKKVVL